MDCWDKSTVVVQSLSCVQLCDAMDCRMPSFPVLHYLPEKEKLTLLSCVWLFATPWSIVHGILQARILEWVAYPFSSGSSECRDQTRVSCIVDGFFINWASLLKFMSTESVMPSNHVILHWSLLLLPSIFPSIRVFSNELALCIWQNVVHWRREWQTTPVFLPRENPWTVKTLTDCY